MWNRTEIDLNVLFIHLRTRKTPFNALVFTLRSKNKKVLHLEQVEMRQIQKLLINGKPGFFQAFSVLQLHISCVFNCPDLLVDLFLYSETEIITI